MEGVSIMPAHFNRWIGLLFGSAAVVLFGLSGCNKENNADDKDVPPPVAQVAPKNDNDGKTIPGQAVSLARLKLLSFNEAVEQKLVLLDPPADEKIPPDMTYNGKNTGKIFETISNGLWDKVVFTDDAGKRLKYHAVMKTVLGDIHIDLFGETAPNHVRNFVCLARTGYFDGMTFYYSLNTKVEDKLVAFIETGCPRGTGEPGSGSIGYWLKPEVNDKLTHEEGVIGACINSDPNSASGRLYITAANMPQMDPFFTIFGKVTQGLDIVRTINKSEVIEEDGANQNRLKQPVLIRSVTIVTTSE
jgi:cyclophilin family peptidyl-prolyl cis-trans isomerase